MTICTRIFHHWSWASNGNCCSKGTRIILGWNHNDVDIVIINQDDQSIHVRVWLKLERKELFCSFVYAHNRYIQRHDLWKNLCLHKHYVRDRPWCILGDFNASLFLHDSSDGNSCIDISMREFKECVEEIEVMDVQNSGLQYTWSQKPKGKNGLLKKIDRIMANLDFNDKFIGAHAIFKPYRNSDHSPSILYIPIVTKPKPKPFKFYNIITGNAKFKEVIMEGWSMKVIGFHMYRVVQKLKYLKKPIRTLLYEKGNMHNNVNQLWDDLDRVQTCLDMDPFNASLREEEANTIAAFNEACLMEEKFLKQKAKIDWLRKGDSNSAYFHKAAKSRVSRSRIDVVTNADGVIFENDKVAEAFVSHYEMFLGQQGITNGFCDDDLFRSKLNDNVACEMVQNVSRQEVKSALFSMDDFVAAVCEFFTNGKILKELNHTIIALIPKVSSPCRVNDYRPISCCNVLFKCISKIIANRIKESLKVLVSRNQSAFVPGRSIADNILLTQELMHNYHLDRGLPRCAFKVDIQKAYDTVDWDFLKRVLIGFGFHSRMINWIMECITTTSFSISINGSIHGFFKGKRGLRQVDPLSPYLFTLIMEILTLMLQRGIRNTSSFTYHRFCSKLKLVNLCFADDLFLFGHGDVGSVTIINNALFEFKEASGLVPSLPKSTAYFCNVLNFTKIDILQILPFEEGRLPVKYLGVPLVSSRLAFKDCKELIERVQSRVNDWKNKSLSAAGRVQLVRSVLSAMHIYWASMFIIPSRVLLDIEQIMRGFVWCQGNMRKGHAKVAWDVVCLPKDEGGQGIRRKILQLRPLIRDNMWYKIGDGNVASLWFDKWCDLSPLSNFISPRDWYRAGLNSSSKVQEVTRNGTWDWPPYLTDKFPMLQTINIILSQSPDCLEWHDELGVLKPFYVSSVWSTIRPRNLKVDWFAVVWFAYCIPRHAFNLWLVWNHMKSFAGLDTSTTLFSHIMSIIKPFANRRSSKSVIAKLVLAASAYFIWQERNERLFKNKKRTAKQVIDCIFSSVRLKLLSCRFKKSKEGVFFAQRWSLAETCFGL
ncbi:hypothetical protein Tco_0173000 [Tanacetum coccineum]